MRNKKIYPFERNHYFFGKLLTVRDFDDEQKYANDKRRLSNLFSPGPGVVGGLDVVTVDDKTISIEMGYAIDYLGREIIVEESVIKKLNMIDGYDSLTDGLPIYLCLDYDEHLKDQAHSIANGQADASEAAYNRVKESYKLFLTDKAPDEKLLNLNHLIEEKQVVFQDAGVLVEQTVPTVVESGCEFEITVSIQTFHVNKPIEFTYQLESKYIEAETPGSPITVIYADNGSGNGMESNKKTVFTVKAKAASVKETRCVLTLNPGGQLSIGGNRHEIKGGKGFQLDIINHSVRDEVINRYYKQHFDEIINPVYDLHIYLAQLQIIRSDNSYIIETLEQFPFKQYAISEPLQNLLSRCKSVPGAVNAQPASAQTVNALLAAPQQDMQYETGTVTIDLEVNARNKTFVSGEIAHGLGIGSVWVYAAQESKHAGANAEKMLFSGSTEIFKDTVYDRSLPGAETGVITYPEKGTFRVGVRFTEAVKEKTITLRWWAVKPSENKKDSAVNEIDRVRIGIEPSTVMIALRERHKFNAVIEGTSERECRWYVQSEDGGTIDYNGLYTAPNKEGVYEVVAESVRYPIKKASAFVVVKKP